MKKKLYRVNELSDLLSIGKSTLWAWVKSGKFPSPVQISSRMTAWPADAIDEWLLEQNSKKSNDKYQ